jgi:hypothetical protein
MSKPKKPESQAFGLRLSVALAERVKALAEANKRTFNGQLVHLLEVGLSATTGERTQTSETWGNSLATSAALAASEAARDAVLRVAREFQDAFTPRVDVEEPERRAPDSKPVRGGRRKAPPADPPERRAADRLTDADAGRWVREGDDARRYAHKMTRLRTGGTADTACGVAVDLRFATLSDDGRRCRKCSAL